ncbi:MAG: response regulator [Thermodesulfobacteriota bacterium]
MSRPIKILLVEDSEDDARLLARQLRQGGYQPDFLRVETAAAMEAALANGMWDLVISDYSLPHFSGLAALKLLQEKGPDLPFIIVSGKIGEETAVAAMKAGAHDYLMKNNLARLIPAIDRELKEAASRRERRHAEEAFRSLVFGAPIGIFVSQNGKFKLVNPGFLKVSGYQEEDLLGRETLTLVAPANKEMVRERAIKMLKGEDSAPYEFELITRSGETRWVVETVISTRYAGERAVLGYFMDLTDHKKLTRQLAQAQKMEAIGRLAGGVAHDFNNLLTVIMGCTDLLMQGLQSNDPLLIYNTQVMGAAQQAVGLIQQLLAFGKKQLLESRALHLNAVVTDLEPMLRRLIGEDIELVTRTAESLGVVKADPGQISQIIMNLVVNARDAMPQGGRLTLETADVQLDESYALKHAEVRPGPYVMLTVSDTGLGMDARTQEQIFDPFFSTKEPDQGTGLGLSTVYGIVKQSDGHIWVYSELGRGTTFKIYLPRVREEAAPPLKKKESIVSLEGTETVLVVEDEEAIRMLLVNQLASHGYSVLAAANGAEALKLAANLEAPIHLVVTDVVMPQMSGGELVKRLKMVRPECKALFLSGYAADTMSHHGVWEDGAPFVQKPFRLKDLARRIREILDEES